MSCRIDRVVGTDNLVVLFISGRITGEHVETLQGVLEHESGSFAINLKSVFIVDREAVKLLAFSEADGIALNDCPVRPISVNGSRERGRRRTRTGRTKGEKQGRTLKMFEANRDCLDGHCDNGRLSWFKEGNDVDF